MTLKHVPMMRIRNNKETNIGYSKNNQQQKTKKLAVSYIVNFIIWQVMKYREICIRYNQYLKNVKI